MRDGQGGAGEAWGEGGVPFPNVLWRTKASARKPTSLVVLRFWPHVGLLGGTAISAPPPVVDLTQDGPKIAPKTPK
eukprot:8665725-Pyramimonas_sp.AAC.1